MAELKDVKHWIYRGGVWHVVAGYEQDEYRTLCDELFWGGKLSSRAPKSKCPICMERLPRAKTTGATE